ncbi:MAG: thiamine pyrophosphate-binding protein [Ruminiclostridium sp.]|nr:thiamine pyrophosphate-binding protein [Ruminiclostridium sp.]
MERIADYIIRKLNEAGASHIFMISGRGILYLTDAVARNDSIAHVCTYHEQGASYAAMAYASATGGISACLVSTGCAAANAVTACLCAYQDNLPVVFVSGNNPLAENTRHTKAGIRTYGSQEADIISVVGSITKYAVMLEDPEKTVFEVEKALYCAVNGRKGPVWIDIPLDVQNMRIDEAGLEHFRVPETSMSAGEEDVSVVAEDLKNASRPVLLIGGGARNADIKTLSESLSLPVAFSPSGCDIYGSANRLSIGAVGSIGGTRAGNFLVQNADMILAVGTKLCSQETGMKDKFALAAKTDVIDIDPKEHLKNGVHIDRVINADASDFVSKLINEHLPPVSESWTEKALHWKRLFAVENEQFIAELKKDDKLDIYLFAVMLSEALPKNASVICDAGFEELIIPSAIHYGDGQRCFFPAAQGAMGYALPAVIGAYCAGRQHLICISGDGSFMMNMQELLTIKAMDIPVSIIVISNDMYAVIRKRQKDLFRTRTVGNDPSDGVAAPDIKRIAECFGFAYRRIETLSELGQGLEDIVQTDMASITEILCTPEQKYLHESYGLNEKGRLVHRPIEDMAPFLDRDLIRREMMIEPDE